MHGEDGCEAIFRKRLQGMTNIAGDVFDKTRQILPRRNRADGTGQHVVEEQGGNRNLGQSPAHGFFDHAVHPAAHKHAAGFDIQRPHRIAEQHDRKDEPGCALADDFLGIAAGVIGGGSQVGQHDRCRPPEGDECQHHRGGDEDFDRRTAYVLYGR